MNKHTTFVFSSYKYLCFLFIATHNLSKIYVIDIVSIKFVGQKHI